MSEERWSGLRCLASNIATAFGLQRAFELGHRRGFYAKEANNEWFPACGESADAVSQRNWESARFRAKQP